MIDKIRAFFQDKTSLMQAANVLAGVHHLIQQFDAAVVKEGSNRNAAIDVIIEILQAEKIAPVAAVVVPPVAPPAA